MPAHIQICANKDPTQLDVTGRAERCLESVIAQLLWLVSRTSPNYTGRAVFVSLLLAIALCVAHAPALALRSSDQTTVKDSQLGASQVSELQTKAEAGDAEAQLKLARAYAGGYGVPQSDVLSAKWYRKAAEQGNADAQNSLGTMYRTGDGVERDKVEALNWYRKAARQNNAEAMFNLGTAYYNGDGVAINDSAAYAWFVLAKQEGSKSAMAAVRRSEAELKPEQILKGVEAIAKIYEKGDALQQNQAEAAHWWLVAAQRGDQDAKIAIASRLLNGQGVQQDFAQARYWCSEAAKDNDHRACTCMGRIYLQGLGVEKDPKKAREWFERAASKGNVFATKELARMYAGGEGGKQDRPTAWLLYFQLALRGDKDVLLVLRDLKNGMDRKEWSKVQKQLEFKNIDPKKVETILAGGPATK